MKALWIGSLAIQKPAFYPVAWHVEAHAPLGIDLGVVCRCRVGTAEQPWAPPIANLTGLVGESAVCEADRGRDGALIHETMLDECRQKSYVVIAVRRKASMDQRLPRLVGDIRLSHLWDRTAARSYLYECAASGHALQYVLPERHRIAVFPDALGIRRVGATGSTGARSAARASLLR
jgi:hypothetical protein